MAEQLPAPPLNELKLVIMGDGGVGKRELLKRLTEICNRGMPPGTEDQRHQRLVFHTNRPKDFSTVAFNIAVTNRLSHYSIQDLQPLVAGANAAIVMFDLSSRITYKNVPYYCRDVKDVYGDATPIVLIGNKVDLEADHKDRRDSMIFHHRRLNKNIAYFDMSAKNGYMIEEPFECLARKLTGDDTLSFVETPAEVVTFREEVVLAHDANDSLRQESVLTRQLTGDDTLSFVETPAEVVTLRQELVLAHDANDSLRQESVLTRETGDDTLRFVGTPAEVVALRQELVLAHDANDSLRQELVRAHDANDSLRQENAGLRRTLFYHSLCESPEDDSGPQQQQEQLHEH